MIVDSNAAAPLKYTDPTFQTSLFVRANIYDTSGGSPSLASTVNLALINNGCYWGKFTYTAGKTYLVQKLVYTDGTYTTVDQTFAQDNDDIQCVDLKTAIIPTLETDAAAATREAAVLAAIAAIPAPDNADIAAIKAKTDNLPADPASETLVINAVGAVLTAVNGIPVNPVLASDARLNHLDANVSSRLAAVDYVAPDNADIIGIKATTDQFSFTSGLVNAHTTGGGGGTTSSGIPDLIGNITVTPTLTGVVQETPNIS